MESKTARYLMCFFGLAAGNFLYAWLNEGDYGRAADNSYFQCMAFLTMAIVVDWRRR